MVKAKQKKAKIKKLKPPRFTADDYAQVLQDLAPDVKDEIEGGHGAVILIKPERKGGSFS